MFEKLKNQLINGQLTEFYQTYAEYIDLQISVFEHLGYANLSHQVVITVLLMTAIEHVSASDLVIQLFNESNDSNVKAQALLKVLEMNRNDLVERFLPAVDAIDATTEKEIKTLPLVKQIRIAEHRLCSAVMRPIALMERFSNTRRDTIQLYMNQWATLSAESLAQFVNKITTEEVVNPFSEKQWHEFYQALMLVSVDCKAHLNLPKLNRYSYPQRASSSSSSSSQLSQSDNQLLKTKAWELVQSLGLPSEKDNCSVEELAWYFAHAGLPTPPEKIASKTACLNFLANRSCKFDYYRTNVSSIVENADDQDAQLSQQFGLACQEALFKLQKSQQTDHDFDDWNLLTPGLNLKPLQVKVAKAESLQAFWDKSFKEYYPNWGNVIKILSFVNQHKCKESICLDPNKEVHYRDTALDQLSNIHLTKKETRAQLLDLFIQSKKIKDFTVVMHFLSVSQLRELLPQLDQHSREKIFVRAAGRGATEQMKVLIEEGGVDVNVVVKLDHNYNPNANALLMVVQLRDSLSSLSYLLSLPNLVLKIPGGRSIIQCAAAHQSSRQGADLLFQHIRNAQDLKIDWQTEFQKMTLENVHINFFQAFVHNCPVKLNFDFLFTNYPGYYGRTYLEQFAYYHPGTLEAILNMQPPLPFEKTEGFTAQKGSIAAKYWILEIQIARCLLDLNQLVPALFRASFVRHERVFFSDTGYFSKHPQLKRLQAVQAVMNTFENLNSILGKLRMKNDFVKALQLDSDLVFQYVARLIESKPESFIVLQKPNEKEEKVHIDCAKWALWSNALKDALSEMKQSELARELLAKLNSFTHPDAPKPTLATVLPQPAKASSSGFFSKPAAIELSVQSKVSISECVKQEFENNFASVAWNKELLENLSVLINNPKVGEAEFLKKQAQQVAARNFCQDKGSQINNYLESPHLLHAGEISPQQAPLALAYFKKCVNEALNHLTEQLQNQVAAPIGEPPEREEPPAYASLAALPKVPDGEPVSEQHKAPQCASSSRQAVKL